MEGKEADGVQGARAKNRRRREKGWWWWWWQSVRRVGGVRDEETGERWTMRPRLHPAAVGLPIIEVMHYPRSGASSAAPGRVAIGWMAQRGVWCPGLLETPALLSRGMRPSTPSRAIMRPATPPRLCAAGCRPPLHLPCLPCLPCLPLGRTLRAFPRFPMPSREGIMSGALHAHISTKARLPANRRDSVMRAQLHPNGELVRCPQAQRSSASK